MSFWDYMPKVGKTVHFPGGTAFCESWNISQSRGCIEGEIIIKFHCSRDEYDAAMGAERLPAQPRLGDADIRRQIEG